MTDVFVSYASEDRDRVAPIVAAIEARRWDVWWDRDIDAGRSFDREIEKAIDAAKCVVVVWSEASVESDWVRTEANEGLERGILVPVTIDPVRPPLAFRRTQTIDLTAAENVAELVQAITTFVPVPDDGGETPYVGREAELERVGAIVQGVVERRGTAVLVAGEAGVGKSRFVEEITRGARASGVVVLTGHCIEMDGAPPYQPVIDQIEHAMRIVPPENLRAALAENAPEVAKLLPELRRLFPDIPTAAELPPDQERRFLLASFCDYLIRAGDMQPMALVFEDLHWADESTCILLRYLAARLAESSVLVIGTYRDTDLGPGSPFAKTLEDLHRERLCAEIRLDRLDRDAVGAMIAAMAAQSAPDVLIDRVHAETDGNPFFVEEVYRHLEEVGGLFGENGGFRTDVQISDSDVPQTVRLVIERRLDRLNADCQTALTSAAVIGRVFGFDLLTACAGQDEDTLLDAIDEAQAANLIEDVSRNREARYRFVHEQIRQTLLGRLSLPRRQRRHLAIAESLESLFARDTAAVAGEIAHHLYRAGGAADPERTANFLCLAGNRALTALAFEDALRAFDLAVDVIGTADQRLVAEIHKGRARCLRGAANVDQALAALAAGVEAAAEDQALADELKFQRAELLVALYRGEDALPDITEVLAHARDHEDAELELELQLLLADAHYTLALDREGYAEKARDSGERAIELARQQNNRHALASSLLSSTHYVDFWNEYLPQAVANLQEARQIAIELNDLDLQLDAQTMGLRVDQFSPVEFEVAAEATLAQLEERRDPIRLKEHLFWMIRPIATAGKLERSVELADRAITLAAQLGVDPVQYPTFKALGLIDLGRFRDALAALALEVADLPTHRFGAALQQFGHAVLEVKSAAYPQAVARMEPLIPEAVALDRQWMIRIIIDLLATCAARCGLNELALQLMDQAQSAIGVRPGLAASAELALARGDGDGALELSTKAGARSRDRGLYTPAVEAAELTARVLTALERWDEVCATVAEGVELACQCKLITLEWRLLASGAMADDALGQPEAARSKRTEATALLNQIADSIDDPERQKVMRAQPLALSLA